MQTNQGAKVAKGGRVADKVYDTLSALQYCSQIVLPNEC